MKDALFDDMKGRVKIRHFDKDGNTVGKIEYDNLVVRLTRTVLRDLMFSPSQDDMLAKLMIGNMGYNLSNYPNPLPAPVSSQTSLINPIFTKAATSRTQLIVDSRPAIRSVFNIERAEANDPNPSVTQRLIAELGMFTQGNRLICVINRPIIKTRELGVEVTWDLLF